MPRHGIIARVRNGLLKERRILCFLATEKSLPVNSKRISSRVRLPFCNEVHAPLERLRTIWYLFLVRTLHIPTAVRVCVCVCHASVRGMQMSKYMGSLRRRRRVLIRREKERKRERICLGLPIPKVRQLIRISFFRCIGREDRSATIELSITYVRRTHANDVS